MLSQDETLILDLESSLRSIGDDIDQMKTDTCVKQRTINSIMDMDSRINMVAFPYQLWWTIHKKRTDMVTWHSCGKAIVLNTATFKSTVVVEMPGQLGSNKRRNFYRQLRAYDFIEVNRGDPNWPYFFDFLKFRRHELKVFYHRHFQQGRPDLLPLVQRVRGMPRGVKPQGPMSIRRTVRPPPSNPFLLELQNSGPAPRNERVSTSTPPHEEMIEVTDSSDHEEMKGVTDSTDHVQEAQRPIVIAPKTWNEDLTQSPTPSSSPLSASDQAPLVDGEVNKSTCQVSSPRPSTGLRPTFCSSSQLAEPKSGSSRPSPTGSSSIIFLPFISTSDGELFPLLYDQSVPHSGLPGTDVCDKTVLMPAVYGYSYGCRSSEAVGLHTSIRPTVPERSNVTANSWSMQPSRSSPIQTKMPNTFHDAESAAKVENIRPKVPAKSVACFDSQNPAPANVSNCLPRNTTQVLPVNTANGPVPICCSRPTRGNAYLPIHHAVTDPRLKENPAAYILPRPSGYPSALSPVVAVRSPTRR